MKEISVPAGVSLILIGVILFIASLTSVGEARSWDRADHFAEESRQTSRKTGMLLGVIGLGALVAISPVVVARVYGSAGFSFAVAGWLGFALGTCLFLMVLGLTNIALPALGNLAARGELSPQQIVDEFVKQPAIVIAFLGGNILFLSWIVLGIALIRSQMFSSWIAWIIMAGAAGGWLGFLHISIFQQIGGSMWPASLICLGVYMVWMGGRPV
jgi:hypothetical protein